MASNDPAPAQTLDSKPAPTGGVAVASAEPAGPAERKPTHESVGSVIAAITANILVGIVKFIAAAISGSVAMVSEGIHSIVDSGNGFLVLLGVGPNDTEETAVKLAEKICRLRVFSDENGKMNRDLAAVDGALLVVSQFTLYADTKSRRPGFTGAAKPDLAAALYERFMEACRAQGFPVEHGEFGADMQVESVNDGPVTILFDTAQPF